MRNQYRKFFLAFGIGGLLLLSPFPAKAWEFAYGPAFSVDSAARRVAPVTTCWGGGYIAVGTQDLGGANPDVYVVRTDDWGWPIWEYAYDVATGGAADEGMAIVEVPNLGFTILSNVGFGPGLLALTTIDCFGNPLWSRYYRNGLGGRLRGEDLIRAQTGDIGFGTAPGDLVVAGLAPNPASDDAFLMRLDAGGNVVWSRSYDSGGIEIFHALTEAAPVLSQTAGDIVAVGGYNVLSGANPQGLVARVDGNTGTLGGAPRCMAHHGVPANREVYRSVTQLVTPPFAGQFAMAGINTNAAWHDDIWVVRGNPCAIAAQSRIGNPPGTAPSFEQGYDIAEVLVAQPGVAAGSLAIAGAHRLPVGTFDAALIFVTPFPPMLPVAGRLFGGFGAGDEIFYSLAEIPAGAPQFPGHILAGSTNTDWEWIGDPQDLYLVHDDPAVVSCETGWIPGGVAIGSPVVNLAPQLRVITSGGPLVSTLATWQWNPWPICSP